LILILWLRPLSQEFPEPTWQMKEQSETTHAQGLATAEASVSRYSPSTSAKMQCRVEMVYSAMARSLSDVRPMLTGPGTELRPLTTGKTRPASAAACSKSLFAAIIVPLRLEFPSSTPPMPVTMSTGQG
jgi:hypothetical protein